MALICINGCKECTGCMNCVDTLEKCDEDDDNVQEKRDEDND